MLFSVEGEGGGGSWGGRGPKKQQQLTNKQINKPTKDRIKNKRCWVQDSNSGHEGLGGEHSHHCATQLLTCDAYSGSREAASKLALSSKTLLNKEHL